MGGFSWYAGFSRHWTSHVFLKENIWSFLIEWFFLPRFNEVVRDKGTIREFFLGIPSKWLVCEWSMLIIYWNWDCFFF